MVRRRRRDSYLGGSTVIGRGGRWPRGGEINTRVDPAGKRFSKAGGVSEADIARLEAERKVKAARRAALQKIAHRQAQRDAMRAKVKARAAALARVIKRFWDEVMKVFRV